ncbi:MAG TPA: flagellar motor switch protein FliN [Planctomycetaceae bacterium]|nr:flagellar motor switch protein FliN [Planctomycetaceae bacterium]
MADEQDDLLDPAEIEALLNAGPSGAATPPSPAPSASPSAGGGAAPSVEDSLSQNDLDSLFQEVVKPAAAARPAAPAPREAAPRPRTAAPDALLNQVEADLARALAPDAGDRRSRADLSGARAFEFSAFDSGSTESANASLEALQEVELDLRIELGRTQLLIEEVLKLREGSVVPLDKLAGDPVDILVNGRLVARGEVLVLNDNFCVRVAEIVSPSL